MQSKNQGKRRLVEAALTILVLTSAFVIVRFLWLDSMVTTDEPFWLGRSGNFYRALRSGDLVNTYQMAHPGVMTMWAGALAYAVKFPEFASLQQTNLDDVYSIERVLRSYGVDPLEMLVAAKISKILLQGVFFGIGVAFLFQLVKPTVGWLACGLLIVSPFLTGFDSILHVDGLFTTICFSALLSIVYASLNSSLRRPLEGDIGWWMIAGGLSACAWLTRTTGIVLFGVAGLCLILALTLSDSRHWRRPSFSKIMNAGLRFGVWAISASITTIILLPALWVDPKGILSRLWSWSSNAASEGHENPTFFLGEIHHGSPGWMVYL